MNNLTSGVSVLNYNYLSLHRNEQLETEFKSFLHSGQLPLDKPKFSIGSYLYLILNPTTEDIYKLNITGISIKNKFKNKLTILLVKLEGYYNSKASLRVIGLMWDDMQGVYIEVELQLIEVGLLFYGAAWFILDQGANSNAKNLITRICNIK